MKRAIEYVVLFALAMLFWQCPSKEEEVAPQPQQTEVRTNDTLTVYQAKLEINPSFPSNSLLDLTVGDYPKYYKGGLNITAFRPTIERSDFNSRLWFWSLRETVDGKLDIIYISGDFATTGLKEDTLSYDPNTGEIMTSGNIAKQYFSYARITWNNSDKMVITESRCDAVGRFHKAKSAVKDTILVEMNKPIIEGEVFKIENNIKKIRPIKLTKIIITSDSPMIVWVTGLCPYDVNTANNIYANTWKVKEILKRAKFAIQLDNYKGSLYERGGINFNGWTFSNLK